jgi:hypothetical protein
MAFPSKTIPEEILQKGPGTVSRFSPERVAFVLNSVSLVLLPCHFWVSCHVSEALADSGVMLFCLTAILTIVKFKNRARPVGALGIATLLLVLHVISAH